MELDELEAEALRALDALEGNNEDNDNDNNGNGNNDNEHDFGNSNNDKGGNENDEGNEFHTEENINKSIEKDYDEENSSDDNAGDSTNDSADNGNGDDDNAQDPILVVKEGAIDVPLYSKEEVQAYVSKQKSASKSKYDHLFDSGTFSEEDLRLLADAKKGNIGAIKKIMGDVDTLDLEEFDGEYKPEFELPEAPQSNGYDEVISWINENDGLYDKVNQYVEMLPSDFSDAVSSSPESLRSFSEQVKDGVAEEILPEAYRRSLTNGQTLLENYVNVGKEIYSKRGDGDSVKNTKQSNSRDISQDQQKLRDKARSHTQNSGTKDKNTIMELTADEISSMPLDKLMDMAVN